MKDWSASILSIGDELLIGQINDTNSVWLGREMNRQGWTIFSKETVGDEVSAIGDALGRLAKSSLVVLVTGGLGPTSDDRTLEAMSHYFKKPLILFPEVEEEIRSYFASISRDMSVHHRKQYYLPEGTRILPNDVGTAPGMYVLEEETHFFFTPGVPVEMEYIFNNHILPKVREWTEGSLVQAHLFTAGIGESDIVSLISYSLLQWPTTLSIAYLPYLGGVRLRLTAKGNDRLLNEKVVKEKSQELIELLGVYFISSEFDRWSEIIHHLLIRENITIATAESCTGGYIASQLTSTPGASEYFLGSVVSYANKVKQDLLGVDKMILDNYGAVSRECAVKMLDGLLETIRADVGIAVTGIAGPEGGSPGKPVGTVFVAVGDRLRKKTKRLNYKSSRRGIVEYTYHQAMYMVYKFLCEQ